MNKPERMQPVQRWLGIEHRPSVSFGVEHPLELACGAELGPFTVAYQTYGALNAACSNAILVCHALTGGGNLGKCRRFGKLDFERAPCRECTQSLIDRHSSAGSSAACLNQIAARCILHS